MTSLDTSKIRELVNAAMTLYVQQPAVREAQAQARKRRVRAMQAGPVYPTVELWLIHDIKTNGWRVDTLGAWLGDDEDANALIIGPNDRDADLQRKIEATIAGAAS